MGVMGVHVVLGSRGVWEKERDRGRGQHKQGEGGLSAEKEGKKEERKEGGEKANRKTPTNCGLLQRNSGNTPASISAVASFAPTPDVVVRKARTMTAREASNRSSGAGPGAIARSDGWPPAEG